MERKGQRGGRPLSCCSLGPGRCLLVSTPGPPSRRGLRPAGRAPPSSGSWARAPGKGCPLRQRARGAGLGSRAHWPQAERAGRAGQARRSRLPSATVTDWFYACQPAQEKAPSHPFRSGRMGFLFCFQGGWDRAGEGHSSPVVNPAHPVDGKSDSRRGFQGRSSEPFPRSQQMPRQGQALAPEEEAASPGAPGGPGT